MFRPTSNPVFTAVVDGTATRIEVDFEQVVIVSSTEVIEVDM